MALTLNYTTNNQFALEPKRSDKKHAGYYLFAIDSIIVQPRNTVKIDTGIIFDMKGMYYGQITDVPENRNFQVIAGVIDPGYRGSIRVVLSNLTNEQQTIHAKDIIAQIIFLPVLLPELTYTEDDISEHRDFKTYLKCTKTSPSAFIPTRFEEGSVGYDLHALKDACVPPFGTVKVDTGIILEFEGGGFYGHIRDKSGFSTKRKLHVINGVIDPSYQSSIIIHFVNISNQEQHIYADEKIAQIIFLPIVLPSLIYQDEIDMNTVRGDRGFGSGDKLCHHIYK